MRINWKSSQPVSKRVDSLINRKPVYKPARLAIGSQHIYCCMCTILWQFVCHITSEWAQVVIKPVRFGGKGRLTDHNIDQLQVFHGSAICNHRNYLTGMERAIWAVFFHSVSTDSNPQHQYCPYQAQIRGVSTRKLLWTLKRPQHTIPRFWLTLHSI